MESTESIDQIRLVDQLAVHVSPQAIDAQYRSSSAIGTMETNGRTVDEYVGSLRDYVSDQCNDLVRHLRAWKAQKHIGLPAAMRRYRIRINFRGRIEHHEYGWSLEFLTPFHLLGLDGGIEALAAKLPCSILKLVKNNLSEEIDEWLIEKCGKRDYEGNFRFESEKTYGLVLGQKDGQRFVIDELAKDSSDTSIVICA